MRKVILCIVLLSLITYIFGDQTQSNIIEPKTTEQSDLTIPLYEKSVPFLEDYRTNQALRQSIRWSNILAGIGAGTAVALTYPQQGYEDMLAVFALSLAGASLGFIGGTIGGLIHGDNLNKLKLNNPDFHTKRYRFGTESGSSHTPTHIASTAVRNYLNFQTFSSHKFSPSEYRLGIISKEWVNEDEEYNVETEYTHRHYASEFKIDFNILFNSNKQFFQFYYGAGIGYSWGVNTDRYIPDDHYDEYIKTTTKLNGIFVHPIAGITINFADFFFGRLEADYELSQFYYKAIEYNNYPLAGNAHLGFTWGVYLF